MSFFPNVEVTIYRETPNGTVIGINEDGTPKTLDCGSTGYDQYKSPVYIHLTTCYWRFSA